jgi:hypothetical protein
MLGVHPAECRARRQATLSKYHTTSSGEHTSLMRMCSVRSTIGEDVCGVVGDKMGDSMTSNNSLRRARIWRKQRDADQNQSHPVLLSHGEPRRVAHFGTRVVNVSLYVHRGVDLSCPLGAQPGRCLEPDREAIESLLRPRLGTRTNTCCCRKIFRVDRLERFV